MVRALPAVRARRRREVHPRPLLTDLFKMIGGAYAGDWLCPNCDATVFATKNNCHKCQTPKPAGTGGCRNRWCPEPPPVTRHRPETQAAGGGGGGGGGYGANRPPCALAAHIYGCAQVPDRVFRTRVGGGVGGGAFGGPQVRPGDWPCPTKAAVDKESLLEALLAKARAELSTNNFEGARQNCSKAAQIQPRDEPFSKQVGTWVRICGWNDEYNGATGTIEEFDVKDKDSHYATAPNQVEEDISTAWYR